jgi:hypothetical protein
VLEVTEIPDLPVYSTVAAEKMSESGPFGGHEAVYRRVRWSLTVCEPPADTGVPVSCRTVMGRRRACGRVCAGFDPGAYTRQSRIAGKSTISRIEWWPVIRRTNRSMPTPMPPVGGMPCSRAWTKTSS